jgi:flagellar hook-length control protein FliK
MQNLPISTTPPATPAATPTPTDNSTMQVAEAFGSVLARQRAHVSALHTNKQDGKQTTSLPANGVPLSATGNELPIELPIATPDGLSTLPNDMLATLPPASADTNSVATDEKTRTPSSTADGSSIPPVAIFPGDMLAALLPPSVTLHDAGASTRPQATVADVLNATRQSADSQIAASTLRAARNTNPESDDITPDSAFTAALQALGKDGANMRQLDTGTTKISAQSAGPDAAASIANLLQNTPAPLASVGPTQVVVNTPVTNDNWGDEFNQKVTWLATQHEQSAELHLNPPNLGPLDIVLKISGDQATALFTSPHAAVREAVEQALPKLREMLADNGIMLGNATVSDQPPREQQAGLSNNQLKGEGNLSDNIGGVAAADGIQSGATAYPARRHQGMVDTFA